MGQTDRRTDTRPLRLDESSWFWHRDVPRLIRHRVIRKFKFLQNKDTISNCDLKFGLRKFFYGIWSSQRGIRAVNWARQSWQYLRRSITVCVHHSNRPILSTARYRGTTRRAASSAKICFKLFALMLLLHLQWIYTTRCVTATRNLMTWQ